MYLLRPRIVGSMSNHREHELSVQVTSQLSEMPTTTHRFDQTKLNVITMAIKRVDDPHVVFIEILWSVLGIWRTLRQYSYIMLSIIIFSSRDFKWGLLDPGFWAFQERWGSGMGGFNRQLKGSNMLYAFHQPSELILFLSTHQYTMTITKKPLHRVAKSKWIAAIPE